MSAVNLSEFEYRQLAEIAAKNLRERYAFDMIPMRKIATGLMEYQRRVYNDTEGIVGALQISETGQSAITDWELKTFKLGTVLTSISISKDELMLRNDILTGERQEKMAEFGRQFALSVFKGFYTQGYDSNGDGRGDKIVDGFLDYATAVEDLDGTDSALTAAGDVLKALNKMLSSLPSKYRLSGEGSILLFATANFVDKANAAPFIASGTNEGELTTWLRNHPEVRLIINNDLVYSTGDNRSTQSRLLLVYNHESVWEWVVSKGFGVDASITTEHGGIKQGWSARGAGCIYRPEAVLYSEQITWS